MYSFRHTNPRLCGYVYRRKVRCGKPNCRCAKDDKYRHTAYYLQYQEWLNGKWKRRSEYVPKNQVRALRARIKRAKQRDKQRQEVIKEFLKDASLLAKRLKDNPFDIAIIDEGQKFIKNVPRSKKLTMLQKAKIMAGLADILAAVETSINQMFLR